MIFHIAVCSPDAGLRSGLERQCTVSYTHLELDILHAAGHGKAAGHEAVLAGAVGLAHLCQEFDRLAGDVYKRQPQRRRGAEAGEPGLYQSAGPGRHPELAL